MAIWPRGAKQIAQAGKNVEEIWRSVKGGGSSIIGTLAHQLALLALYATHLIEGKNVGD
jgi:hypothetical protein